MVLSPALLRAVTVVGNVAAGVSVGRLELDFPTATRPLRLRVHRVSVVLQQLHLPKVGRPGLLASWVGGVR